MIFKPAVEFQAKNWLSRKRIADRRAALWNVFSPGSFCNYINYGIQDPFVPDKKTSDLAAQLTGALKSNNADDIESAWDSAKAHIDKCRQRYELEEVNYFAEEIEKALATADHSSVPEEEREYIELLTEEISTILHL